MDVVAEKLNVLQYSFVISRLGKNRDESIKGTMVNQLSFNGGNQFATSGEMVREGKGGFAGIGDRVIATGSDILNNKVSGRQLGGYGRFNKSETRSKWTESARPQFTCEFTLLANTANDAFTNMNTIKLIKSATLPINDGGALLAPLGYKGREEGTITFALGTWLVVPKLVMVTENCIASLQVMSNGYPLYWNCLITMETFETITIDEFQRYFQQPAVLYTPAQQPQAVNDNSISGVLNDVKRDFRSSKYGLV